MTYFQRLADVTSGNVQRCYFVSQVINDDHIDTLVTLLRHSIKKLGEHEAAVKVPTTCVRSQVRFETSLWIWREEGRDIKFPVVLGVLGQRMLSTCCSVNTGPPLKVTPV